MSKEKKITFAQNIKKRIYQPVDFERIVRSYPLLFNQNACQNSKLSEKILKNTKRAKKRLLLCHIDSSNICFHDYVPKVLLWLSPL